METWYCLNGIGRYIANQEEHHRTKSFSDEYNGFMIHLDFSHSRAKADRKDISQVSAKAYAIIFLTHIQILSLIW